MTLWQRYWAEVIRPSKRLLRFCQWVLLVCWGLSELMLVTALPNKNPWWIVLAACAGLTVMYAGAWLIFCFIRLLISWGLK